MKLILKDIIKSYDKKDVIKKASFEFEKGKIYGLLGRNGSGKTTLFDCVYGELPITSGSIMLDVDGDINRPKVDDVGYVLSTPSVPGFLTAREFVKFFIDINKEKIANLKTIDEYLDIVGIKNEDRDRLIKDYSLGMKNKVQLLMCLIVEPKVILLDEPLSSFDVVIAEEMKKLLINLKAEHIIIFSTHIMELAIELCDEIVILSEGTLSESPKDKEIIIERLKKDADA